MDPLPPKVFLSYSHIDKIVARRVVRRLTTHGIKVWFDDHELRLGAALTSSIQTHIKNADTLLVIASQASANSPWVEMELNFAKELGKSIVPIFIEPLSTHQRFKNFLGLDASSLYAFAEVIDKLMRELYESIDLELPAPDRDILTLHLRELAEEEPNLAPLILGYLDSGGLRSENADTVYSVAFHELDDALNSLFDLSQREDLAICAARGFSIAGVGAKVLSSWIAITGNGGEALSMAVGQNTLALNLIPTAINLLGTCTPPNNTALHNFIHINFTLLDEVNRRSILRLVTWPVRADSTHEGDTLAWVALKHFPTATEVQQMWIRWIDNGAFDGKPEPPRRLAYYLSQANKEQLPGWESINEALRQHVRRFLRSQDGAKVNTAIDHVMATAEKAAPVLKLLLREINGISATSEWEDWSKTDPVTAELFGWHVHFISEEALGDKDWMRARNNAREMVEFEKTRKEILQKKNGDN